MARLRPDQDVPRSSRAPGRRPRIGSPIEAEVAAAVEEATEAAKTGRCQSRKLPSPTCGRTEVTWRN